MKNLVKTINQNSISENLNFTIFWISFICALLMLYKTLSLANVGVDLTDEGYYFNWISNPWLYKYYASQFGYIYYPLYKMLGDSVVLLRQANMLISFVLCWLLGYFLMREHFKNLSHTQLVVVSACLSLPALLILMITGRWLPTPSYNSLNFQGCLIAALGIVLSISSTKIHRYIGVFLIGFGGWLAFMAKPSTALLLVVATSLFYLPTINKDWRVLLSSALVSVVLLVLSALCIDGSVIQFIHRYQGGFLLLSTLSDGYGLGNLIKLDFFSLSVQFKLKFIFLTFLMLAFLHLAKKQNQFAALVAYLIALVTIFFCLYSVLNPQASVSNSARYHGLMIAAPMFAAFLFCLFNKCINLKLEENRLTILFLVLPYLFAAGSGNNYWQTGVGAGVFWVYTAVLLASKFEQSNKQISLLTVFVLSITFNSIFIALNSPYRQSEPILSQSSSYTDTRSNQNLLLSQDTAKYLNNLNKALFKSNFQPNTPLIDLTGHHPGALYFMQAQAIGQAWTSGGYAGSYKQATLALYQASCEDIANAWLLIEVEGKRQLSEMLLAEHGLDASIKKYQVMVSFKTQKLQDFGSINQQHPDGRYIHYLLKPIDVENQTKACLAYRKAHPNPFDQL